MTALRKLAVLLVLVSAWIPALAATRVTVAELEQAIAAAKDKPDAGVAQQLSDLELSERLSDTTLAKLKAELPGEKSVQELGILADQSAFLALPVAEIPPQSEPDAAAQRQIMAEVVNYVTKTVHRLPNLIATRATHSFADRPAGTFSYLPLRPVAEVSAQVVYRDGREVDTREKGQKFTAGVAGLTSWGEFGPILSTVLMDAAQNTLAWSHWEQGAVGNVAVFRYAVPEKKSHYQVQFCCISADLMYVGNADDPENTHVYRALAGYHGEMAVDPESGAILRITVIADPAPDAPVLAASIMVEYGPVEIGGKSYIGPVKSVALAESYEDQRIIGAVPSAAMTRAPIVTQLNDVSFEQYHIFRTDLRMLSPEEAKTLEKQQAGPPPETAGAPPTPAATPETPEETSSPVANLASPPATEAATPSVTPAAAPAPPTAEPGAASPAPAAAASDIPAQTPVFRTGARDVVVDVVVSKSNGDTVSGLGRQDFAIAEDGKPQTIDFFEEHKTTDVSQSTPPVMPSLPRGAVTNVPPAAGGDAVNVLLIDTLNTEPQNQVYIQKQIAEFLEKAKPGTRMAIFLLGPKLRFVQGFTSDTSLLLAALNDKKSGMEAQKNGLSRSDAADDQADITNLQAMRASPFGVGALQKAQGDARARDYAARASMTFEALNAIAHYLAGVQGRKNLIWFSGSFPVVIFPSAEQRRSIEKNPALPGLLGKVTQTENLFTVAQISVYPISAQGMMTEQFAEADSISPVPSPTGVGHIGGLASDANMSPYSAGAAERANAMDAMEQLAASTGGKAFFNTNDLNQAIEHAISDGEHYYTIAYSPTNTKMDGSYRAIDVKVAGKYKLAYRHGYNAEESAHPVAGVNPLTPLLNEGMPAASGVLFGVRAAAQSSEPGGASGRAGQNSTLNGKLTRYGVDLTIRTQDLALQMSPDGRRSDKVLIGLKAYDAAGKPVNWLGDEETITVNAAEYEALVKTGMRVHLEIDVPRGMSGQLVTAVYDQNSGNVGALEIDLKENTQ